MPERTSDGRDRVRAPACRKLANLSQGIRSSPHTRDWDFSDLASSHELVKRPLADIQHRCACGGVHVFWLDIHDDVLAHYRRGRASDIPAAPIDIAASFRSTSNRSGTSCSDTPSARHIAARSSGLGSIHALTISENRFSVSNSLSRATRFWLLCERRQKYLSVQRIGMIGAPDLDTGANECKIR